MSRWWWREWWLIRRYDFLIGWNIFHNFYPRVNSNRLGGSWIIIWGPYILPGIIGNDREIIRHDEVTLRNYFEPFTHSHMLLSSINFRFQGGGHAPTPRGRKVSSSPIF